MVLLFLVMTPSFAAVDQLLPAMVLWPQATWIRNTVKHQIPISVQVHLLQRGVNGLHFVHRRSQQTAEDSDSSGALTSSKHGDTVIWDMRPAWRPVGKRHSQKLTTYVIGLLTLKRGNGKRLNTPSPLPRSTRALTYICGPMTETLTLQLPQPLCCHHYYQLVNSHKSTLRIHLMPRSLISPLLLFQL